MYVTAGIVVVVYTFLLILARKEKAGEEISKLQRPFYKMAVFLYKRACICGLSAFMDRQVEKDLERLHPGESREQLCTAYYVKKTAMSLMLCLAGTILGVMLCFNTRNSRVLNGQGEIVRGSYLEQEQEISLEISSEASLGEALEGQAFNVKVRQRKLTGEEAEALYCVFWDELQEAILGDNQSLGEVKKDLQLAESLEGYPFLVEWKSEWPDLISSAGKINTTAGGEVMLTAVITYEDMEWQEQITARLIQPVLSQEEQQYRELEELLQLSENESREERVWKLPDEYRGQTIIWKQAVRDNSLLLWGGILAVSVLVYFLADKDLHDNIEARKKHMKRDYPDIVQKLVLYIGAGMTIRGAFQKIAGDYEQKKNRGGKERSAYEEMLYTCRELQTGMSEAAAYEYFGKRTGLQEYIRLCTLLQQNLKKGNSTLLARLREEADKSVSERVQGSRRRGEEAMTKLLIPMVLLLLVVMVIIMIPAFSATTK